MTMTLSEFYRSESGLFAQAFQPLQNALTRQAERLWNEEHRLPPWLTQPGKGGAAYRRFSTDLEISLYRHVMDVTMVASYLFYYAWQTGRLNMAPPDDIRRAKQALAQTILIAFVHDADKYTQAPSQSPAADSVLEVVKALNLSVTEWPGMTIDELVTAVNFVEQRGLTYRLIHAPLPVALEQLALFVAEGDNLMSVAWRKMSEHAGSPIIAELKAFIEEYNARQLSWSQRFGTPNSPFRLVQWYAEGVILHRLLDCLLNTSLEADRYPLAMVRQGDRLVVAWPTDIPLEPALDTLQDMLIETTPTIQRTDTTGKAVLQNGRWADDLIQALENDSRTASRFLTVHQRDWDRVEPFLRGWMGWVGQGVAVPVAPPATRTLFSAVLPPPDSPWDSWPNAYQRAVALAAAVATEGIDSREQRWGRLIGAGNGLVLDALNNLGIDCETLHPLTATTVAACVAAQVLPYAPLEDEIATIHGPFAPAEAQDGVVVQLVDKLREQVGLPRKGERVNDRPYQIHPQGGTCLMCGAPTTREIATREMPVLVGRSAFNNRMGHQKSLWSQSEPNFLCDGCLHIQMLMKRWSTDANQNLTELPLRVATPVRHLVTPPLRKGMAPTTLRSYDAVGFKQSQWTRVLPWQSDLGHVMPLSFEQPPEGMDKVLDQIWRFSRYAWISGEPVHVFVTHQRSVSSAFYYEPMPVLLQTLLQDLLLPDGRGVLREHLEAFIQRVERLKVLVTPAALKAGGLDALLNIAVYRWWAIAVLASRMAQSSHETGTSDQVWKSFSMLHNRRDFPMPNYDDDLLSIAEIIATHQRQFTSGSDYTWLMREALMIWETTSDKSPLLREHALRGRLRADMERRADWGDGKTPESVLEPLSTAIMHLLATAEQHEELTALFQRHMLYALESLVREIRWKRLGQRSATSPTAVMTDDSEP